MGPHSEAVSFWASSLLSRAVRGFSILAALARSDLWRLFQLLLSDAPFPGSQHRPELIRLQHQLDSRGNLCTSLRSSAYVGLASTCSNVSGPLPAISAASASLTVGATRLFGFLLPALQPGNFLKALSWGNSRAHFVSFHSLRGCWPVLPHVQCLKTVALYLCSLLVSFKVLSFTLKPSTTME